MCVLLIYIAQSVLRVAINGQPLFSGMSVSLITSLKIPSEMGVSLSKGGNTFHFPYNFTVNYRQGSTVVEKWGWWLGKVECFLFTAISSLPFVNGYLSTSCVFQKEKRWLP